MPTLQPTNNEMIDIIMGTYNGETYIQEQINSLQNQTYNNWKLVVRDDGSTDKTRDILEKIAAREPRIHIISDSDGNLGFNKNFHRLLSHTDAQYVMFCDQDDSWLQNKIQETLDLMHSASAAHKNTPILVHCDSIVTDSSLNTVREYFVKKRAIHRGLTTLLFANSVQGASMMINSELRNLMLRTTPVVHFDYKAALISEACGHRFFIDTPLFRYRQHSFNALGAGQRHSDGSGESADSWRTVTATYQTGLDVLPAILSTLDGVSDKWHPKVSKLLQCHEKFIRGKPSTWKLYWLLRSNYQYFRRIDTIVSIFYALGFLRAKTKQPTHSFSKR